MDIGAAQVVDPEGAQTEQPEAASVAANSSGEPLPMYTSNRDWTPELVADMAAECVKAPCFFILLDSSESPFEQLARIAASETEQAPKVMELLQAIKKEPAYYLRDTPIEDEAVFLRHVQDAITRVSSITDGSLSDGAAFGDAGTTAPEQDPLEFAETDQLGVGLGPRGLPNSGSIESPWRWVLRDRQPFAFIALGGSRFAGSFTIEYLISLSGFNARLRQTFQVHGYQMKMMLTDNSNTCTVDLRPLRFDRPCQNQPNPSNDMYVWSSRITQPRARLHNVYDNSYERKFFKFRHSYMLRNDSLPRAVSPVYTTWNGPSPRYECRREWSERYRCQF